MTSIQTAAQPAAQMLPDGTADLFRQLWRGVGATVALIATEHEGARHAMLATAVTSVSMAPPSLLVCVNRDASAFAALEARGAFSLGILPAAQHGTGAAIARAPGAERFDHGTWQTLDAPERRSHGLPWLAETEATLFCTVDTHFDHGTHCLFIATIETAIGAAPQDPLLYQSGRFGRFAEIAS
ncbi:flavin reductase family protein [Salipiger sp. P9]|uniref:flavin reductase family protein n=1 Tax=Salipiger pentaromativorans TaxID=2943193 RepID=UPI002158352B|nr:flavin reductase family protein [Salipiger pentaromativorans]MCR8550539.1 flavin reductase family protein [Salipiger pentaromativorans]